MKRQFPIWGYYKQQRSEPSCTNILVSEERQLDLKEQKEDIAICVERLITSSVVCTLSRLSDLCANGSRKKN